MEVLLLSADQYELTDETTGEIRKGSTFWYINDYREDNRTALGHKPTKISGSVEAFEDLYSDPIKLPAKASMSFDTRPGAGGKATLTLSSVNLIEHQEMF